MGLLELGLTFMRRLASNEADFSIRPYQNPLWPKASAILSIFVNRLSNFTFRLQCQCTYQQHLHNMFRSTEKPEQAGPSGSFLLLPIITLGDVKVLCLLCNSLWALGQTNHHFGNCASNFSPHRLFGLYTLPPDNKT
jgi:hypothetical protein